MSDSDAEDQLETLFNELEHKIIGRIYPPPEVTDTFFKYCEATAKQNSKKMVEGLELIVQLRKKLENSEEELRKTMKPHMEKSGFKIRTLQALRDHISWPDLELDKDWIEGVPLVGPTRRSNYFPLNKRTPTYSPTELAVEIEKWKRGKKKARESPPDWMTKHNRLRLEGEVEKLAKDIELREYQEGENPPRIYAFGVEQGKIEKHELLEDEWTPICEKLRLILDWKQSNKLSPQTEKVELYSHTVIQQLINTATKGELTLPATQTKKDLNKQINETIKNEKENSQALNEESFKEKRRIRKFIPYFVKIDFEKYFFQNLVEEPKLNNITYWQESKRRYKSVYSDSSQFGNIHSLWTGVRMARLLQEIVSKILGIPCIIYIDDAIIIVYCPEHAEMAERIVCLVYKLLGIKLSKTKIEKMSEPNDGIELLGLLYQRSYKSMRIEMPERKRLKIIEMLDQTRCQLQENLLEFKQIEKVTGNLIYYLFSSASRILGALVSYILAWSTEEFYKGHIRNTKARDLLSTVINLLKESLEENEVRPVEFKLTNIQRAMLYTDASFARNRGHIGGIIEVRRNNTKPQRKSFNFKVKKNYFKEPFKLQDHIGLYEMLAAIIGPATLRKGFQLEDIEILQLVDNIPSLFWLVKKLIDARDDGPEIKMALSMALASELEPLKTNIAYDYIKSAKNPGDWFTRDKLIKKTYVTDKFVKPRIVKKTLNRIEQRFNTFLNKFRKQNAQTFSLDNEQVEGVRKERKVRRSTHEGLCSNPEDRREINGVHLEKESS